MSGEFDYRRARGAIKPTTDEPAEVTIRRLRDGDTAEECDALRAKVRDLEAENEALRRCLDELQPILQRMGHVFTEQPT